jgi:hypothetical protein
MSWCIGVAAAGMMRRVSDGPSWHACRFACGLVGEAHAGGAATSLFGDGRAWEAGESSDVRIKVKLLLREQESTS